MQHRILPNILVCGEYTACQMTANAVRSVCFCTENSAPLSGMKWIHGTEWWKSYLWLKWERFLVDFALQNSYVTTLKQKICCLFISYPILVWKMELLIAQLLLHTELPHLSTTDSDNIAFFIANAFCSILGFLGKCLIQITTGFWTLLHSFISQTAAYGDKTAGNAAL